MKVQTGTDSVSRECIVRGAKPKDVGRHVFQRGRPRTSIAAQTRNRRVPAQRRDGEVVIGFENWGAAIERAGKEK